jgi:putative FmdB family regulatory protein
MPRYTFECQQCSTRFDRTLKMGDHPTHPCPSCKEEAPRLFDKSAFGFGFAAGGTAPANSGVHDQDYPSADKVVGRSAEARWATYRERDKVKKQVRQVGGSAALERLDGDGYTDYAAMGQPQLDARAKLVDLAVAIERQQPGKPAQ